MTIIPEWLDEQRIPFASLYNDPTANTVNIPLDPDAPEDEKEFIIFFARTDTAVMKQGNTLMSLKMVAGGGEDVIPRPGAEVPFPPAQFPDGEITKMATLIATWVSSDNDRWGYRIFHVQLASTKRIFIQGMWTISGDPWGKDEPGVHPTRGELAI